MKLISISLSPNTEKDDIMLALKLIFQPWQWKNNKAIKKLEDSFKEYLDIKHAISFNSGRSCLFAILGSVGLEKGDEVILQAFTCNAVVNPILWHGLKPVFADIDEKTLNINPADLERKVSAKCKAVIIQHTFGLPAEIDEIKKICKRHNLILIEDCAHSLGSEYGGKKVGTLGKIAFFSFSRDKIISSVYGGMVTTDDPLLAEKILEYQKKFSHPSYLWILQQLLHPVLMNKVILPTYSSVGRYILVLFQWFHIFSKAVHWKEKRGLKPSYFPKRLPGALAVLALNQFKKINRFNAHRKQIADFYANALSSTKFKMIDMGHREGNVFLRFPIQHDGAHQILRKSWNQNLLLGDWYTTPIAPHDTKLYKIQYLPGSCPVAEKMSKITMNLPTHINISKKEAEKNVEFLKQFN